jgi:hypothetical protein
LIVAAALSCAPVSAFLTAGMLDGAREAAAQQVSSARFVPTAVPAPDSAPAFGNPSPQAAPAPPKAAPQATQPAGAASAQPAAARPVPAAAAKGTGLAGRVTGNSSPLAAAGVYAYQLADLALFKVLTDPQGNFLFRDLPAGLYKIIAHKPGFEPVVILVTRTTAKTYQFLELQLALRRLPDGAANQRASGNGTTASPEHAARPEDSDFWALRARIPPDVLRDIEASESPAAETKAARAAQPQGASGSLAGGGTVSAAALSAASSGRFHTEVQAMTGVANVAQVGPGQVSSGKLGIEGQLGQVLVGLSGRFWQMSADGGLFPGAPRSLSGQSGDGKTSAVSLDLEAGANSKITVTSLNNRLMPRTQAGQGEEVGLDHYQVKWSQALGENSHSDFAAQYTSENNYHRLSAVDPVDIPDASRTWNVEGSYTTAMGESGTLQTGFRYTENQLGLVPLTSSPGSLAVNPGSALSSVAPASTSALSPNHQTVDVFARGGTRLQPAFMVEYGLYTTLMDGSVSLTPQGGLVLQLDDGWQAHGSVTHRAYQSNAVNLAFLPALFKESDLCEQGGRACYELNLSHHGGSDDTVSFSAIERIVGQTLRLYFSDVVFDRLESLYLVPGDRLPELHFVVSHRLTPQVRTSFESSVAAGGGGTFIAADGRPYKNQIRYVVTSLDTRFLNTSTGVFLAFHHLSQGLSPLGDPALTQAGASGVEFDRLQLTLSQDLNSLWNLASQWAVQVNMELSRSNAPYLATSDSQLQRRILGGIAVKF